MLDDLRLIHQRDSQDLLGAAARRWAAVPGAAAWRPQSATADNLAKQLALELMGKSVVVYAAAPLAGAAVEWKRMLNRHARQLAWSGELADGEITSWTGQPVNKQYGVVRLRSSHESADERQQFTEAARLLSGRWPEPTDVWPEAESLQMQQAYCQALGEFVALYLALLNGFDPAKRVL